MKLLVQRVARANVEVNGFVESRIGNGMIVYVAVRPGDSLEQAHRLAAKVVKLNLWPDIADLEKKCCTNVIDNGFEVLAIFQQSLISNFSKLEPSEGTADSTAKAKEIFEAFVQKLREEYQEEMVVAAPADEELRVELTAECPGVYELDTLEMAVQSRLSKSDALAETERLSGIPLEATVDSVTKCLQRIPLLPRNKATVECMRVYHAFGMKKFRAALADASSNEVDTFGEALDGAAHLFTTKQQEQITMWTGLAITAVPREDDAEQDQLEAELEKKLAKLEQDVGMVKTEGEEGAHKNAARMRPDWTGRPAPYTPGTAQIGRSTAVGFQGKGKGKGKGKVFRSFGGGGIASLSDAAQLHGLSSQQYHSGQLMAFNDAQLQFQDGQDGDGAGTKRKMGAAATPGPVRFKKGAPTVAPLTPMPTNKKNNASQI